MAKNVKPQKRGMVAALVLACLFIFFGLLALRTRPALRQQMGQIISGVPTADGGTNAGQSAQDVLGHIFSTPTARDQTTAPAAADDDVRQPTADRVTMAMVSRGAIVGAPRLLSGNAVEVGGQAFTLWGIQIPATNYQCTTGSRQWFCGDEATKSLRDFIGDRKVGCYPKGQDLNGHAIGRCFVGYIDLGSHLVEEGWALQQPRITNDYNMVQELAKAHRAGLWGTDFDPTTFLNNAD